VAWRLEYDAGDRLVRGYDAFGEMTAVDYDAQDNPVTVHLPGGQTLRYRYALSGDLMSSQGGREGLVAYSYDALGREVAVTDATGGTRRTRYDRAGRVVGIGNEMDQWVRYTYDAAGNRVSLVDANLNTTTFEYDRDGLLVRLTYPAVAGQPANIEEYAYDAPDAWWRGRRPTATPSVGSTTPPATFWHSTPVTPCSRMRTRFRPTG
ncbi:MAG: hypothetical protein LIP77_01110, partial [Planctomycetes bacterium]|nr:hypothetical protein [Planctomycetota bacterium]